MEGKRNSFGALPRKLPIKSNFQGRDIKIMKASYKNIDKLQSTWKVPLVGIFFILFSACSQSPVTPSLDVELPTSPTPITHTETVQFPGYTNPTVVNYEVIGKDAIFEGDIILGDVDENGNLINSPYLNNEFSTLAVVRDGNEYLWPNSLVPFKVRDCNSNPRTECVQEFGGEDNIELAIQAWEAVTSIRFISYDPNKHDDYIEFVGRAPDKDGKPINICSSPLGRTGSNQKIKLTSNGTCSSSSLIHEIGHTLGLFHEQSRSDRDAFVTINFENIRPGSEFNFCKAGKHWNDSKGKCVNNGLFDPDQDGLDLGGYDFNSIMHYSSFLFCIRDAAGTCVGPTIVTKDPKNTIESNGLSNRDKAAINALYGEPGEQQKPAIATDKKGNFVLVWEDDRDSNGLYQIFAQGFNANGTVRFNPVTVNSIGNGQQFKPAVAMNDDGKFVVVWEDDNDGNGLFQILGKVFNKDGSVSVNDFTVNSVGNGQQFKPDVAIDGKGNFVVVWEDDKDGNGSYQILARGFTSSGRQKIADFAVNTAGAGQQLKPSIAMNELGNFVVAWEDDEDKNNFYEILARGFFANGRQSFSDIAVNSKSSGQQLKPDVAIDANGNFTVVWQDDNDKNGQYQILARGFYSSSDLRFSEITVNSVSNGQQLNPAIAMNTGGDFIVTWEDDKDQNGRYEILARGFNSSGRERFSDITVNSIDYGDQLKPVISAAPNDGFIVAWQDKKPANNSKDVMARAFYSEGTATFLDITMHYFEAVFTSPVAPPIGPTAPVAPPTGPVSPVNPPTAPPTGPVAP